MPEVKRLVLAMAESGDSRRFRLGWSAWRRAHQALAARCRASRQGTGGYGPVVTPAAPQVAAIQPQEGRLTDAEWEMVRHLLPPQRPPIGRPRHDHRIVLSGILSVVRARSSWREMPEEFGKWETAYRRYRLWQDSGLWHPIAEALGIQDAVPSTK